MWKAPQTSVALFLISSSGAWTANTFIRNTASYFHMFVDHEGWQEKLVIMYSFLSSPYWLHDEYKTANLILPNGGKHFTLLDYATAHVVSCKPVTSEGFNPRPVHWDYWIKWHWNRVFFAYLTNFRRGSGPVERQTAKCMSVWLVVLCCQYHSIRAPCSFVHLSPALCNLSSWQHF